MTNPTCPHCGVGIGEHEAGPCLCLDQWVGEIVTHVVPRRLWIATSDGGKSATRTSEYQHEVEQWVKEHPVVFGKPMWVAHWDIYPRYSRDISAAWEVLEWLRDKDCDVALCSAGATWLVESNVLGVTVRSESAPLAICRAAVLAAGEKP